MRSHKRERFLLYLWNVCNKCSHPSWRLDTYRPLHVFESHRTHTSYLGSQEERRGRADSHGGLETAGAGSDAKLRLRRAGGDGWTRSCLLASSPRREPELTSSPRASTNSLPSHLTSPQRGSGTCRVCDPFAVQNCSPQTLRLELWGSCQAAIWKSSCKIVPFWSHRGVSGVWVRCSCALGVWVFFREWNLNPIKVNGKNRSPLSPSRQIRQFLLGNYAVLSGI